MMVRYSVTFEYEARPPQTFEGTTAGGHASVCMSRAVKVAQKALKPMKWTSCVCVLLERLPAGFSKQA